MSAVSLLPAARSAERSVPQLLPDWAPASLFAFMVVFPVAASQLHASLTPVVVTVVLLSANDVVQRLRSDPRAALPVLAGLAAVVFSLLLVRVFAQTEGDVWASYFQKLLVIAPLAAVGGYLTTRSGRIAVYLRALLAAVTISAPLAWYEWSRNALLLQSATFARNGHVRAVVAAEHPLVLATLFVAMLPVAVWLLPGWRGRALAVLLYASVWTTDSNGPEVVGLLVLVLALWPWLADRVLRPSLMLVFFGTVGCYLAIGAQFWSYQVPGVTTADVSNGYRAALYHLMSQLLVEHPLGFGLGGLPHDTYYFYTALGTVDVADTIDSEVVLAATRFGVLGVVGFATMCAVASLAIARHRPVALGMLAIDTVGFFLALHAWTSISLLWFLLLGSCLAVLHRGPAAGLAPAGGREEPAGRQGGPKGCRRVLGAGNGEVRHVRVAGKAPRWKRRLRDDVRRGWRRAAFIVVVVALGGAAGAVASGAKPTQYTATAQIFISAASVDNASGLYQSSQFTQARVQSYVNVVDSPLVLDAVASQLGLPGDVNDLATEVSANAPLDKTVINVVVVDHDPTRAADVANAVAKVFIDELPQIETRQVVTSGGDSSKTISPLKLTIIHPAVAPSAPSGLRPALLLVAGSSGGLVLALGVLVLSRRFSRRVRGPADVEQLTGVAPIAVVPWDPSLGQPREALAPAAEQDSSEAFRRLRAELRLHPGGGAGPSRVAVVAAQPGAGGTAVAIGLASALARAGNSVLLVDAAMGRASLHERTVTAVLGLADHPGLVDASAGTTETSATWSSVAADVDVVPRGTVGPGGPLLRMTRPLERVLGTYGTEHDVVIIDAGSVTDAADTVQVLEATDVTVVVAAAEKTPAALLQATLEQCGRAGVGVAGVVLNKY